MPFGVKTCIDPISNVSEGIETDANSLWAEEPHPVRQNAGYATALSVVTR